MLDRAQIVTVDNRFRFKVRHASNSRRHNTTGFLILQDGAGHCGYGEFLTREYVTGESVEQAQGTLSQLLREFPLELIDEPFRQLSEISSRLTGLPGVQAALCALDLAILDLSSKRQGRSIAALFGNEAVSDQLFPQYTAVYPLTSSWKLQGLALVYHRVLGLSEVKLKGSGDLETDCRVLRALRKFLPSTCSVRIDFNEQLSQLGAAEYLATLRKLDARLIAVEQPFSKTALQASAELVKNFAGELEIIADESCCSAANLEQIIASRAFNGVNLRIAKNGGLIQTYQLAQLAREAGLSIQLGCYVGESSLLAAAGLQLASLLPELRFLEGGFSRTLLKQDVVSRSLGFDSTRYNLRRTDGFLGELQLDHFRRLSYEQITLC